MKSEETRLKIGTLFQSIDFSVQCANLGKPPEQQLSTQQEDWLKVSMSLPRLYAVVEAAEIALSLNLTPELIDAIEMIADGSNSQINEIANRCARLAWQSQQPLLGVERISRPIMGCTSGNLPEGELEKDVTRVRLTAELLLSKIK